MLSLCVCETAGECTEFCAVAPVCESWRGVGVRADAVVLLWFLSTEEGCQPLELESPERLRQYVAQLCMVDRVLERRL